MRSLLAVLALAALPNLLAAAPAPAAAAPAGPVLNIDWMAEPPDLNSVTSNDEVSFNVLNAVMEGLTRIGAGGRATPAIAEAWTVSDGGRTYTFHLRDALWSNGDPVTAGDFVYAWQQVLNPCNAGLYAYLLQYIRGASALLNYTIPASGCDAATNRAIDALEARLGLAAPNPRTLVVTLTRRTPYWLGLTADPTYLPLDQAWAQRWGVGPKGLYATDAAHMVYDGPFVISAWVHHSYLDLAKNPRYWDAAHVHLAGVHGVMVSDAATAVNLFETGKLDVLTSIPSAFVPALEHLPGYHTASEASTAYLQFNVGVKAFSNRSIRLAFSEAIDRQQLARDVVRTAAPAFAFTPPAIHYAPGRTFNPLVGRPVDVHAQPAAARADLARGLHDLGLTVLPTLTLLTQNTTDGRLYADALQAMWQQNLGVAVQVRAEDFGTFLSSLNAKRFDMVLVGWGADYDDPNTFLNLFTTGNPSDSGGWSSPYYDRLITEARRTSNLQARGETLAAAEKYLLRQMPVAPLFWLRRAWIEHRDVSGLTFFLTGADYSLKGVRKS